MKSRIFNLLNSINHSGSLYKVFSGFKGKQINCEQFDENVDGVIIEWPDKVEKPFVGLIRESFTETAYWPKYQRFLINNKIPFEYFDIHLSNFVAEAKRFDIIIWHTLSNVSAQWEAKSKVELLEKNLHKKVLPSAEELWFYEDKIRQQWLFEINKLPYIPTFISFSKSETENFLEICEYPLVAKEPTNSGSQGVYLLKDIKSAKRYSNKVFGPGRKTILSYHKQKDYVYFQKFIENDGFDLRVIIVGRSYFGYYRKASKGDFKASGAGNVIKQSIPTDALFLAKMVKEKLHRSHCLAVDLIKNSKDGKYYIIEVSIFIRVETPEQLMVNDVPGRYILKDGDFNFLPGRYWIQELALEELFMKWLQENYHHR